MHIYDLLTSKNYHQNHQCDASGSMRGISQRPDPAGAISTRTCRPGALRGIYSIYVPDPVLVALICGLVSCPAHVAAHLKIIIDFLRIMNF